MITANELKYNGCFNKNGLVVKISGFRTHSTDKTLVRFENIGGEYGIDTLQPIPLTEEILLKCGFKQDKGMMCYRNEIDTDIKIVYETLAKYYRLYPRTNKILYVHQFQNLYFALTGEELTINL